MAVLIVFGYLHVFLFLGNFHLSLKLKVALCFLGFFLWLELIFKANKFGLPSLEIEKQKNNIKLILQSGVFLCFVTSPWGIS